MDRERLEDYNTTVRVAKTTARLMRGGTVTTSEVADFTGLTWSGAWYMLWKISQCEELPLTQDKGRWFLIEP